MPRKPSSAKNKKAKAQASDDSGLRRCIHCHELRNWRRLDKHEHSCRQRIKLLQARKRFQASSFRISNPDSELPVPVLASPDLASPPSDIEMRDLEYTVIPGDISDPAAISDALEGPSLPMSYIKIILHHHSLEPPRILPLSETTNAKSRPLFVPKISQQPWAPFRNLADFEFTEAAITGVFSTKMVDKLLAGIHGGWSTAGSNLTLKKHGDMEKVLASARQYVPQFKQAHIEVIYQGKAVPFDFQYRDPWEVIVALVADPSLADDSTWHSAHKILCRGGFEDEEVETLFDEPFTAEDWWETDSSLPGKESDGYTHCWLPVHIWLDKGNVTTKVKKHPMLLHALWLFSKIRNASGNGGGVLLGYVPIVKDPGGPEERTSTEKYEFQQFKKEVYQAVQSVVFASLRSRSRNGDVLKFGDGKVRVGHPGIAIESMDGEEIAHWTGVMAANANHPCPKCLVHKCDLHRLSLKSTLWTSTLMQNALKEARSAASKTDRDKILQCFGMHNIDHFQWQFKFSDPYAAASYDVLHFDDLGKWGKHLWPLLLRVLEDLHASEKFNTNMNHFPVWPGLKRFETATNIEYSDVTSSTQFIGSSQCCLPCLVEILPRESPMLHCIRAYQCYRMMVGLSCHSSKRLERLENKIIPTYERCCEAVADRYGKNFDFFKQHLTSHVVEDIRRKGSTANTTTRPGEGFQQEAAQAYKQTNGRNAESQKESQSDQLDNERADLHEDSGDLAWTLKAPQRVTDSTTLEKANLGHSAYKDFDLRLRNFVEHYFPDLCASYEEVIKIYPFRCFEVRYQSLDDWTEARDLLRCNPNWNNAGARYDSILINTDDGDISPARLVNVFRCKFMSSGKTLDIALVNRLCRSRKWKPRTVWDGYQVFEEDKDSSFISMEYIVRGVLLAPAFNTKKQSFYTLVDCADYDMFLRANKYN
ncbi:hypothetical protein C8J56DRAFT_1064268 [Mycena floridula]|nr:hypothetical protein C8J56DRAFT_1064268 [Mycena floridula]